MIARVLAPTRPSATGRASMRTTGSTSRDTLVTKASATSGSSSHQDRRAADRQQRLGHLERQRARHARERARLLGAQQAVPDREEVAREALEQRAVVRHQQALLDALGKPRVGIARGRDEARVLGVRVVALQVERHARDALRVEPRGERREGLHRHEEPRRREGQPDARLGVPRGVESRADRAPRRAGVDRTRPSLERRRLLEPSKVGAEAHQAAAAVRAQRRVGAGGQRGRRCGEALVAAHVRERAASRPRRSRPAARSCRPIFAPVFGGGGRGGVDRGRLDWPARAR